MKNIMKTIMVALVALVALGACAQKPATNTGKNDMNNVGNESNVKTSIVVYFTHSNNTGLAAQQLAKQTGSDLVRILPEESYSTEDLDWTNQQSRCTREHLDQTMRPAIKPLEVDFSQYDTVYIGFPIWWHEEPAVIRTFLDETDLKGKELYPFCTSYESPMSEADSTLQKGYPDLKWHEGLRFPADADTVRTWLSK